MTYVTALRGEASLAKIWFHVMSWRHDGATWHRRTRRLTSRLVAALIVVMAVCAFAAASNAKALTGSMTESSYQAAGHPDLKVQMNFAPPTPPFGNLKNFDFTLPRGIQFNTVMNACTTAQFNGGTCPASTQVGAVTGQYDGIAIVFPRAVRFNKPINGKLFFLGGPVAGGQASVGVEITSPGYPAVPPIRFQQKLRISAAGAPLFVTADNLQHVETLDPSGPFVVPQNVPWAPYYRFRSLRFTYYGHPAGQPYFVFNTSTCATQQGAIKSTGWTVGPATVVPALTATGCGSEPFNPSFSWTPTPNTIGQPAGIAFNYALPSAQASIQDQLVKSLVTTLPGYQLNYPHLSTMGTCSENQLYNSVCPASSVLGQAALGTPLYSSNESGTIYLMQNPGPPPAGPSTFPDSLRFAAVMQNGVGVKSIIRGHINQTGSPDVVLTIDDLSAVNGDIPPWEITALRWSAMNLNFTQPAFINAPGPTCSCTGTTVFTGFGGAVATRTYTNALSDCCTTNAIVQTSGPPNGSTTNDNTPSFGFTPTGDCLVSCTYQVDAMAPVAVAFTSGSQSFFTAPALTDGWHTIEIICTDSNGNVVTLNINIQIDTTAPVVSISVPANGSTTATNNPIVFFTWTDANPNSCTYTITDLNTSLTIGSGSAFSPITLPTLPTGPYKVTVSCTDQAGNVGSASVTFNTP